MVVNKEFEASIFEYTKTIQRRGEVVFIEYTSNEPIHLIFHILLEYLKQNNISFVITDAVDQLHILKAHLELAGINTSLIDEAQVVKLGGAIDAGNVLQRIDLKEDLPVLKQHYVEAFRKIWEEKGYVVRIVVGLEKVLGLYEGDPFEIERFFGMLIRPFLGNKNTAGIILLNTSLVGEKAVLEAREVASRVFDVELREREIILKIVKSVNFDELGRSIKVSAQELQKYLAEDSQNIK